MHVGFSGLSDFALSPRECRLSGNKPCRFRIWKDPAIHDDCEHSAIRPISRPATATETYHCLKGELSETSTDDVRKCRAFDAFQLQRPGQAPGHEFRRAHRAF